MSPQTTSSWRCALELRPDRSIASGSHADLCAAVSRGADLRVYTEWLFEEHIAPDLPALDKPENHGLLQEVIDFRQTYLIDGRYAAGVTTLRQSILPILGLSTHPRTSFFFYGMDGQQGSAHVNLDASASTAAPGSVKIEPRPANMPKMSEQELFDEGTHAWSRNFIYDFERYRYFVRDEWEQVLAHDAQGNVSAGSFGKLHEAHHAGRELKVGIRNLCADLATGSLDHEVFTLLGSGWTHTAQRTHESLSHPLVRIAPGIPLRYGSGKWDAAWLFLRTTGRVGVRRLDPYTRKFHDSETRLALRWFAR